MTRAHVRLLGPCFKTGRTGCRQVRRRPYAALHGRRAPRGKGAVERHCSHSPATVGPPSPRHGPAPRRAGAAVPRSAGGPGPGRRTPLTSQGPPASPAIWPPANRSQRSPRGSAPAATTPGAAPALTGPDATPADAAGGLNPRVDFAVPSVYLFLFCGTLNLPLFLQIYSIKSIIWFKYRFLFVIYCSSFPPLLPPLPSTPFQDRHNNSFNLNTEP